MRVRPEGARPRCGGVVVVRAPQGARPLGYVNDEEKRNIVIDKPKAKLIKKAFELYATGEYPLFEIRKKINRAIIGSNL